MTEIPATSKTAPETPGWRPHRPSRLGAIIILLIAVGALVALFAAWRLPPFDGGVQATENAYVRGRTTVIAPQVGGYVASVEVRDYQTVRKGQVLARIDDSAYSARVAQARANLSAQLAALANSAQAHASRRAGLEGQTAALASARAQLIKARADMARADDLVRDGSISVRERDQTLAALRQAEAQVRQTQASGEIARQDIRSVDVGRGGLEAQVEAARAALQAAEIDLGHTVITAPEDGQVGEIGVRLGQFVSPGTQLLSLVPPERWIIANYRETQTRRMRPGQRVSFTVDALGGRRFTGRIENLSPATGSEFAVLKPDNATGNFIKVPQRIGVRIVIEPDQADLARLRPGMSVRARVAAR